MSIWDKQVGGKHYRTLKIQPSKFVVENKLLFPEGKLLNIYAVIHIKGKKKTCLKRFTLLK